MWNSNALMTLADFLIIGLSTAAALHFVRSARSRNADLRSGLLAILAGLVFTALFYAADLGAMHVAPLVVTEAQAVVLMERLHLDARWALSLASVGLISAGLVSTQRDMRYRLELEQLVAASSTELIAIEGETIDQNLEAKLRRIGEFIGADSGYIFAFSDDREFHRMTHSWRAGFAPRSFQKDQRFHSADRPWTVSRLLNGEPFVMSTLGDLPGEARTEGLAFQSLGLRSLILVPMAYDGGIRGFLGFGFSSERHRFRRYEVSLQLSRRVSATRWLGRRLRMRCSAHWRRSVSSPTDSSMKTSTSSKRFARPRDLGSWSVRVIPSSSA